MSENNNDLRNSLWVFGYGSLMSDNWETDYHGTCEGKAILKGYYRAFNKKSTRNWGSAIKPCPTLGLERSIKGECVGLVFKFTINKREAVVTYLKDREGPSFQLVEVEVELEDGQKEIALTPINQPGSSTYIGNINFSTLVNMARNAKGENGRCFDYIHNIYLKCKELGIKDKNVQKLWKEINKGEFGEENQENYSY